VLRVQRGTRRCSSRRKETLLNADFRVRNANSYLLMGWVEKIGGQILAWRMCSRTSYCRWMTTMMREANASSFSG